jgi:hypothetical protein
MTLDRTCSNYALLVALIAIVAYGAVADVGTTGEQPVHQDRGMMQNAAQAAGA